MKIIAVLLPLLLSSPLSAATLKFEWIGGPTYSSEKLGHGVWSPTTLYPGPLHASFTFDVDYAAGLYFQYSGKTASYSPYLFDVSENSLSAKNAAFRAGSSNFSLFDDAEIPAGVSVQLSLNNGFVSVKGAINNYGDQQIYYFGNHLGDRLGIEVNDGQYYYYGDGFWRALYNGRLVGSSQLEPGPVPLPASLPLLLAALAGLMLFRHKKVQLSPQSN